MTDNLKLRDDEYQRLEYTAYNDNHLFEQADAPMTPYCMKSGCGESYEWHQLRDLEAAIPITPPGWVASISGQWTG